MQRKYAEDERLLKDELIIYDRSYPRDHPHVARLLGRLAEIYHIQKRDAEAVALYQEVIKADVKNLGPDHQYIAVLLTQLADVYKKMGRHSEAQKALDEAGRIRRSAAS